MSETLYANGTRVRITEPIVHLIAPGFMSPPGIEGSIEPHWEYDNRQIIWFDDNAGWSFVDEIQFEIISLPSE